MRTRPASRKVRQFLPACVLLLCCCRHDAPTPQWTARQAFEWAGLVPGQALYELGCGDGRVAIVAAEMGARVVCVEIDPRMVALASEAVRQRGMQDQIEVRQADLFETDVSGADVVFFFLLPGVNERLKIKLERELKPGTLIISREFPVEGWPKEDRLQLPGFLFFKWTTPVPREGGKAGQPH